MRISDWSSDVCSSDLRFARLCDEPQRERRSLGDDRLSDLPRVIGQKVDQEAELGKVHGLGDGRTIAAIDLVEHQERSEERRVGQECVSTCRSRWAQYH